MEGWLRLKLAKTCKTCKTCNEEFTGVSCTNLIIEENYPFSNSEFLVENGSNDELKGIVQRFWETKAIGVESKPKHDRTDFLRNTKFKAEEGHYEVKLPRKQGKTPRSTGFEISVKRLRQLQSRLKKDKALFRDYDHIIREQEREGIVEQTIINENDGYFLPHHGVIRQDKETTKLRIVFDGSAKPSEDDLSLNECWNNLIHFASICMYYFESVVVRCSVFGFILSRLSIYCYGELA